MKTLDFQESNKASLIVSTKLILCGLVFLCWSFYSFDANAAKINQHVRVCSGKAGGTYEKAAHWVAEKLKAIFSQITIVPSDGSLDTHIQLGVKRCDFGFVQGDSYGYFDSNYENLLFEYNKRVFGTADVSQYYDSSLMETYYSEDLIASLTDQQGGLYLEEAHLLCNRKLGVNSLEEILDRIKEKKEDDASGRASTKLMPMLFLGPSGGGTIASYHNFTTALPELKEMVAKPIDTVETKPDVKNGVSAAMIQIVQKPNACFLYFSRIPNKTIAHLDQFGGPKSTEATDPFIKSQQRFMYFEKVEMIDIELSDLVDMEDKRGNRIYVERTLEEDDLNYRQLRMADGNIDTDQQLFYTKPPRELNTIATSANWVTSTDFYDQNISSNDELFRNLKKIAEEALALKGKFPEVKR